jgi:FixJ family two-component response regulator
VTESGSVVYVVDDDPSVREALESLLRSAGLAVTTFASASEFSARPRSSAPACLVLDLNLPEGSGLDVQRDLAKQDPMPIVFITGHGDVPTSVRAMKAGAIEFLPKPFRSEALIAAVEEALESVRKTWDARADLLQLRSRVDSLTPRQREVLALVVAGKLNKQIAHELGITEVTVKGHRGQIMRKLNANSIAELVRMAGRVGIG